MITYTLTKEEIEKCIARQQEHLDNCEKLVAEYKEHIDKAPGRYAFIEALNFSINELMRFQSKANDHRRAIWEFQEHLRTENFTFWR